MNIIKLVEESAHLLKEVRKEIRKLPGQMNLLELTATAHLENKNSDILAYLINPKKAHHRSEFGKLFLLEVNENRIPITATKIISVIREKVIDNYRRIDLFIETDSEAIVFENKINANDQPSQIKDYLNWAEMSYPNKKVIVLYLTIDGSTPEDKSLPTKTRHKLIAEKRYASLNYEDDILSWLEKLLNLIDKNKEPFLYSGLLQYQDSLKGLYGIKEETLMENKYIEKNLYEKYGNHTREDLIEVLDSIEIARNKICSIAVINFLKELHSLLSISNKVFYTHYQKRFSDEESWISSILKDGSYVGLEVALENNSNQIFGLGIEFSSLDIKSEITYGVMSHGRNTEPQVKEVSIAEEVLYDWSADYTSDSNKYWFKYVNDRFKWAIEGIFRTGKNANWEKINNFKLVEHISNCWFLSDLESYKKRI